MNAQEFALASKAFCRYRWDEVVIHFGRGEVRTCCRTWSQKVSQDDLIKHGTEVFVNSAYQLERRREMLQGIRHSDCKECWDLEDRGLASYRKTEPLQYGPAEFEKWLDKASKPPPGKNADPQPFLKSHRPASLVLFLDNRCDLKCGYCYYGLSTSWAAEHRKYQDLSEKDFAEMDQRAPESFEQTFWQWFDEIKSGIKFIGLVGGEPSLMPQFYRFLNRISEALPEPKSQEPILTYSIVSNLNCSERVFADFKSTILNNLSRFAFELDASMESWGEQAEYIRYGVKFDRWLKNFEDLLSIQSPHFRIGLSPTINSLCGTGLIKLLKQIHSWQLKYNRTIALKANLVSKPLRFSPFLLNSIEATGFLLAADYCFEVDRELQEKGMISGPGSWRKYGEFLKQIFTDIRDRKETPAWVHEGRKELVWFVNQCDSRRGTDVIQTFPELTQFMKECR